MSDFVYICVTHIRIRIYFHEYRQCLSWIHCAIYGAEVRKHLNNLYI